MRAFVPVVFLVACKGGGGASDGLTDYTFECEVSEPFDLGDIYAEVVGREHECEGQPEYIEGLGVATAFFLGEFHWDDCGNVQGRESWLLWSDARLIELGMDDCQVVWDMTGEKGAPVTQGTYSLTLTGNEVTSESTCPDDLAYETTFTVTYDVVEAGGTTSFYYATSGNFLGQGSGNGNHSTYVTDLVCEILGYGTF